MLDVSHAKTRDSVYTREQVYRWNFEFNTIMHMYFWFSQSTFCGYLKVQVTTF